MLNNQSQPQWEKNLDIPSDINYIDNPFNQPIQDPYDLRYRMTWYVDPKFTGDVEKVWAMRCRLSEEITQDKDMGYVVPKFPSQLDVIFISYNEPNAEENWQRVLSKAPYSKRINGIKGIVNAHKSAAKLATTDMFYVVDGDAWLEDSWHFNFQPSIFDRDCVHVWHSRNPVNGLEYGYGGVKLLPRNQTLDMNINNPDMTTSISSKFKVILTVSNITAFNTDKFNAWRSGFRECVKLASASITGHSAKETQQRLDTWCTVGHDQSYGDWAIKGAIAGRQFGQSHKGDLQALDQINDFNWLESKFNSGKIL